MAKFFGKVGYANTVETAPGVYTELPIEKDYYGDVVRSSATIEVGEKVDSDISVNNSIRIVADAFAFENFYAIRYVKWAGTYWLVTSVQVVRPRLILQLGGVYNGITGATPGNSGGTGP